jgi:cell wall-associated NlpC family hydrolase
MNKNSTCFSATVMVCALILGLQGCASLEPMPRFRTSSLSFAPDQLPLAQRSTSELLDPTKVGSWSLLKEEAARKASPQRAEAPSSVVFGQTAPRSASTDEIGLDREQLDEELGVTDEVGSEEPANDESIVVKFVRRSAQTPDPVEESEEANPAINRVELMKEIVNLLGNPYRYGGMNAVRGLDCSAFVGTVYSRALGVRLPRSSNEQFGTGVKIRKNDMKVGDLVFFKTRRKRAPVSHVGIYIGGNYFAHASTHHGVIISPLDDGYYNKTFVGARRLLNSELTSVQH